MASDNWNLRKKREEQMIEQARKRTSEEENENKVRQSENKSECLILIEKSKQWYYNLTSRSASRMMQNIVVHNSKKGKNTHERKSWNVRVFSCVSSSIRKLIVSLLKMPHGFQTTQDKL